ncbi:hypothetical protein QBC35DRAFT_524966 [Podospora australis]|uniref:rRNA-processing protein EFG1 n=1 Tax=Podospora australis TaxID=1536484 RepID=A0AAN6WS02_9PEZI|nr:hypothetical protein QBC35DRAFT_524966 [Podospora australis]
MGIKRPHSEAQSSGNDHMHPSRKKARNDQPWRKPKARKNVEYDSMNALKKRARAIERLLAHATSNLPANKQKDLERELAAHKQRIGEAQLKKRRSYMIGKYHMVRFFERKKAMRLAKQIEKKLAQATDSDEIAQLKVDLHKAQVDIDYAIYYPFLEPYISLYANPADKKEKQTNKQQDGNKKIKREEDSEGAEEETNDKAALYLHKERPPMWFLIEETREQGKRALEKLQNRISPDGTDGTGDNREGSAKIKAEEPNDDDNESDGGFFEYLVPTCSYFDTFLVAYPLLRLYQLLSGLHRLHQFLFCLQLQFGTTGKQLSIPSSSTTKSCTWTHDRLEWNNYWTSPASTYHGNALSKLPPVFQFEAHRQPENSLKPTGQEQPPIAIPLKPPNLSSMAPLSSSNNAKITKRKLSTSSLAQSNPNKTSKKQSNLLHALNRHEVDEVLTVTMATATTPDGADDSPIDLSTLKTWIQQHEANPKPLTPAQRRYLTDFIGSLKVEEPDLGDRDWISLLQRFRDAHRADKGTDIHYTDEPVPTNSNNQTPKFTCTVTLTLTKASKALVFPNPEAGYVGGGSSLPAYSRKKDAKRYAARCCVEWLMREQLMPSDGQAVAFPSSSLQAATVNRRLAGVLWQTTMAQPSNNRSLLSAQAQVVSPSIDNSLLAAQAQSASASQVSLNGDAPLEYDADVQITDNGNNTTDSASAAVTAISKEQNVAASKQVLVLCKKLGLVAPQYVLTSVDSARDRWNAKVNFGPDACRLPDGLGQVKQVYSKRFAKEAVAEQVLVFLQGVLRKREAELREVTEGL